MFCEPLETCPPGLKIGPNFSRMLIELPNGKENQSQIFWLSSGDPPPPPSCVENFVLAYLLINTLMGGKQKYSFINSK